MSLQYKAYLIKANPNNVKEIRRFTVDADVSSNYEYLRKKVSTVFPNIGETNFSLQYKDVEGDFVSFSSDEELMEALGNVNDGMFRLYVKVNKEGNKKAEGGPDFCKAFRQQFGHFAPGQYPHEDPRMHGGPPPPPPPPGHHHPPPPFGGPFPGHPPRWGVPHFAANWGFPCGQFQAQGQASAPGADTESQASSASGEQTDAGQQQQQQQTKGPADTATEYLNSVGEVVAGFLKPLGIDVDIDVEHNGKRSKCKESEIKKKQREEEEKSEQTTSQDETVAKTTEEEPAERSPEGEWTVVQDGGEEMHSGSPKPQESMVVDPPSDLNPQLAEAIKQMQAMGFSDDGGWLSRLLTAHDCDISRALDAMQPSTGYRA